MFIVKIDADFKYRYFPQKRKGILMIGQYNRQMVLISSTIF